MTASVQEQLSAFVSTFGTFNLGSGDIDNDLSSDGRARLSPEAAHQLYQQGAVAEIGAMAHRRRLETVPGNTVTYLIDRNINYTNVCNSDCSFCGFYRPHSDDPESYVLNRDELRQKVEEALELGATRILLQGGHNDDLPYDFYPEMIRWLSDNFPIELNAFSPSEIHQMHLVSGKSYEDILIDLQQAGMKGLPGGGAELLSDAVRKRVSPKKIAADIWIEVMRVAHSLALTTTATMVIGFGESLEQRIEHFTRLRDLQDESLRAGYRGFNAFISWPLQHNENTSMGRSRHRVNYGADSLHYLRNVAIGRLFLDNIPHHAASWPTLGVEVGKLALHFGCDDFGSTMMEENVVSQAGALTQSKWSMSPEELQRAIQEAGFEPAQRDSSYAILQQFGKEVVNG
ncbi:MAG: CofH family radical SAM protein [Bdellovibrionales bacterium]|nr:CofH family radical SAM protein [Bdellovibrionales bacterium]